MRRSSLKILIYIASAFIPLAAASNVQAQTSLCPEIKSIPDSLFCASYSAVLVLGSVTSGLIEVKNSIGPNIDVLVELDDGKVKPGLLTPRAATGRTVVAGDLVKLDCSASVVSLQAGGKLCHLRFTRKDYFKSMYPKNNPLFGVQSPWSITVGSDGIPDGQLLKLN